MTREDVLLKLNSLSKNSLELAWVLAEVYENKLYHQWGFRSFSKWAKQDDISLSRGYLFSLCRIGRYFKGNKEEITESVVRNKIPIRTLIDLVSKVDQGLPKEIAIEHICKQTEIPEEYKDLGKKTDPESPEPITLFVPKGDFDQAKLGLVLYCLRNGLKTDNEAFRMFCLDESQNPKLPKNFEKWWSVILAGKFKCKLCGDLPLTPTHHHILPRSLFQGWGLLALLCLECHDIVQKDWKNYAKLWLPHLKDLLIEYQQIEKAGTTIDPEEHYYDPNWLV